MSLFQSQPLRGLIVAVQFMTRVPTPSIAAYRDDDLRRAANWIPATGVIVGLGLAVVYAVAALAIPIVAAIATLVFWVWVTGALHLDGLADSADGLAAARGDTDRFLEVAREPQVGAFGVVSIVLVLLAKFATLGALAATAPIWSGLAALVSIPALARLIGAAVAQTLPGLGGGRGADFKAGLTTPMLFGWAVGLGLPALVLVPAVAFAGLAMFAIAVWYWRRAIDAMTGDTIGATIEVVECGMLVAFIAWPMSPVVATLISA